jgi:hypothetical protein
MTAMSCGLSAFTCSTWFLERRDTLNLAVLPQLLRQLNTPSKVILMKILEENPAFTGRVVILNRRGTWHLDNSTPT